MLPSLGARVGLRCVLALRQDSRCILVASNLQGVVMCCREAVASLLSSLVYLEHQVPLALFGRHADNDADVCFRILLSARMILAVACRVQT